jgi:hypothetical protein
MNDNVIENLIARLPRPTPSQELDSRIAEITNQASPERKSFQARQVLLLVGTAACAGFLGFALGRQSGSPVVKNEVAAVPAAAHASLSPPAGRQPVLFVSVQRVREPRPGEILPNPGAMIPIHPKSPQALP